MNERERRFAEIERKHLGQCLDQVKASGGRTIIEKFYMKTAGDPPGRSLIVVKDYDKPVSSGKGWPDMRGCRIYVEIDPAGTFDSSEMVLEAIKRGEPIQ